MKEIAIAIIGSSAFSAIITNIFNYFKNRKHSGDSTKVALRKIFYDRIKEKCKHHIANGYITSEELEDLIEDHRIYHDELDGNGFLDKLMKAVKELEIV